jgi:branched-chain amino acid transport system ATP-binding protein
MSFFRADNLVKHFGGLAAVNGVSFEVNEGEIFGLIGPNGSGKTTLFNLISGFHKPTSGGVYFMDKRIDGLKPHKINRLGLVRTFQVVKPLKRMTVEDNVIAAAFARAGSLREARQIALETIEFCGLTKRKEMLAKSLTIGDRKRLEITRAMATGPKLILLDETFAGLNPSEQDEAIGLIRKIKASGVTIIIVEHIMKVIMSISDRVHAINFGQTLTEGTPSQVVSHPGVVEAYLGEAYHA